MSRGSYYKTVNEYYNPPTLIPRSKILDEEISGEPILTLRWNEKVYANTEDPEVWGRPMWFSIHNGAAKYPLRASKIVAQHMKGYILGLPYMLPCQNCSEHTKAYTAMNYDNLDDICSGRMKLFNFFVQLHNYVNKRYGKPIMSTEEAYKLYTGKVKVSKLSY